MNYTNPQVKDEDDEDLPSRVHKKPYQHYEHTFTSQHVHFYLSEDVGDPSEYTDMIHRINVASENDTVFIHLNTPGGRLDTGVQIINAMQNTDATVVTILEAEAFSLGTLIFLAGDELVVNDHCMIMFHNFKGGVSGKGHEQLAQLGATVKWFTAIAREIYIPFLTEDEFNGIIEGKDLWMHSAEIRERIQKMMDAYEAEAKEVLAEAEKTAKAAANALKVEKSLTKRAAKK
jgi:ATP-dependent Clp protease protease subunit